jgi:hypothetical protein
VLCRLRIGHRHEAHADGRVLICPDDDLAHTRGQNLLPEGLRPEPGQPGPARAGRERPQRCDGAGQACRQYPRARRTASPRIGLLLPRSAHVTAGLQAAISPKRAHSFSSASRSVLVPAWQRIASAARGPHHRSPPVST